MMSLSFEKLFQKARKDVHKCYPTVSNVPNYEDRTHEIIVEFPRQHVIFKSRFCVLIVYFVGFFSLLETVDTMNGRDQPTPSFPLGIEQNCGMSSEG